MADRADLGVKAYGVGRLEGGELPPIGKLVSDTVAEFSDNLGPYLLATLGQYVVGLAVGMPALLGFYLVSGIGLAGFTVAGNVIGQELAENVDPGLGAVAQDVTRFGAIGLLVVAMLVLTAGLIALISLPQASLHRAIAAHQRGEGALDFKSSFTTARTDLRPVMTVNALVLGLVLLTLFLCYLPSPVVLVLFGLAPCLVAIHGIGATEALSRQFKHAVGHPAWAVRFGLVTMIAFLAAAYVPVIGNAFLAALQVRACRHLFGDRSVEPVLAGGLL